MKQPIVMTEDTIRELRQVDDEFTRFVDSAWNKLEDDVITSSEDKPELDTVTARYFKDHLQNVFSTKDSCDSYVNLWLHLLSIRIPKTDFYKKLPPKSRAIYFGNSPKRFNPGAINEELLYQPKTVASALMFAIETAHGSVDIGQYPINALLLLDLIQNDKHNARKVLRQLGLSSPEIDRLIEAGSNGSFIRDNVISVLYEFSGANAAYDSVFKKALDRLKTSNIKLLFGTINNDRLVKKGTAMQSKTVKIGQTTTPSEQSRRAPTAPELAVSYSSFWPVLLSLAGLSVLGLYAYYNWFGKDEGEKADTVDLTGDDEPNKKGKRQVIIKV